MSDDKVVRSRSNSFKENQTVKKNSSATASPLKRTFSFKDPELSPHSNSHPPTNDAHSLIQQQLLDKQRENCCADTVDSGDDHSPPLFKASPGFKFELGSGPHDHKKKFLLVEHEKHTAYYQHYFQKKEHLNLMGTDEKLGPVIISVENPPNEDSNMLLRALIRTKEDEEWVFMPSGSKSKIKALREAKPELANTKLVQIDDPQLIVDLTDLERKTIVKQYKMGVLVMKEGQTKEEELFSNCETPPALEELLSCLATKITLQGWTGFRGGLDVKTNTTGNYSYHTKYIDTEVMFHVSTFLPFFPLDYQQLERKRHLGNDVIMIIYKEGNTPFDPQIITSEFCHYFVVLTPEPPLTPGGNIRFRVGFAAKEGVKPMEPFLASPPIFEKGIRFREFLLTKLINSERSAMCAPSFIKKMARTRMLVLQDLIDKYTSALKKTNFTFLFRPGSGVKEEREREKEREKEKKEKEKEKEKESPKKEHALGRRKSMELPRIKKEDPKEDLHGSTHGNPTIDVDKKALEEEEEHKSHPKKPVKATSSKDLKQLLEEKEDKEKEREKEKEKAEKEEVEEKEKEKKSRILKTTSVKKFFKEGGTLLMERRKSQNLERTSSTRKKDSFHIPTLSEHHHTAIEVEKQNDDLSDVTSKGVSGAGPDNSEESEYIHID